jgi:hypothetical protein
MNYQQFKRLGLLLSLVRCAERVTGTTWPQWPFWLQRLLMKLVR